VNTGHNDIYCTPKFVHAGYPYTANLTVCLAIKIHHVHFNLLSQCHHVRKKNVKCEIVKPRQSKFRATCKCMISEELAVSSHTKGSLRWVCLKVPFLFAQSTRQITQLEAGREVIKIISTSHCSHCKLVEYSN